MLAHLKTGKLCGRGHVGEWREMREGSCFSLNTTKDKNLTTLAASSMKRSGTLMTIVALLIIVVNNLPGAFGQVCFRKAVPRSKNENDNVFWCFRFSGWRLPHCRTVHSGCVLWVETFFVVNFTLRQILLGIFSQGFRDWAIETNNNPNEPI